MAGRRGFIISALLISFSAGCTHLTEDRTIAAFTDALAAGDMQQLRALTSNDFGQKALRRSESLDDLQVLRLPEEPPAIVEVKDVSDTVKEVTVTEPEGTKNLLYRLVLDESSNSWLVDDIFTKQQKQGVTVAKPITEQMDLLLTIRDFLEVWEDDNRERVLEITTPKFRSELETLPAPWLARITQQVVGNSQRNKSKRHHKPQVSIDGPEAVVRLPRTDGTLQLSMELTDGNWEVADVAINTRREATVIRSVRNRARVINAGTKFVEAFRRGDHDTLSQVTTKRLYESALKGSNLQTAKIPDIMLAPEDYELKATVDQATMLIPTPQKVVRIEFDRIEEGLDEKVYRVSELSLYDSNAQSEMLLSSYFTATKRAREFHAALLRSDAGMLTRLSSSRFSDAVWSKADGLPIQLLPIGAAGTDALRADLPQYDGPKTKVTMHHKGGSSTYVLVNAEGRLVVDDVLVGTTKQRSLRTSLELAIPILAFATGVRENDIRGLQRVSSHDFNRLVWSRAEAVPKLSIPVLTQLTKPIRSMKKRPGQAIVELGSPQSGAIVQMEREKQHWVIDNIEIINGLSPSQHVQLKQTMRTEMIAELKGLRPSRTQVADASTSHAANQSKRKRFNLSLNEPPPRKSLALNPSPSAKVEVPEVIQVSGLAAENDPGVQHAVMFAPVEKTKSVASTAACGPDGCDVAAQQLPGIISPAQNATPLASSHSDSMEKDVDLDALFGEVSEPTSAPLQSKPAAMPVQPTPAPTRVAEPQDPFGVPLNDTSRVTDPALQPIKIPTR